MKEVVKLGLAASIALVPVAIATVPVEAASFNFSYVLENGDTLAGMLDGDLQGDGDTVFVNAINMPTFNGVLAPDLPFIQAFSTFSGGPDTEAKVSLSGLVMDIIACTSNACMDGFLFDGAGFFFGVPVYSSSPVYGDTLELYDPTRWTLTAKATESVPEPTTMLGLFVIGGLGLGLQKKLKQVA